MQGLKPSASSSQPNILPLKTAVTLPPTPPQQNQPHVVTNLTVTGGAAPGGVNVAGVFIPNALRTAAGVNLFQREFLLLLFFTVYA
jgi:hypothetical protein